MPKGPHEQRLDGYVTGGKVESIRHSAHVWDAGHHVLANLATALESAKPQLMDRFGPQTGPAAVKAFQKVADNVRSQASEMKKASTALGTAGDALEDAQTTHHQLGNAPASPPTDPTQKAGETSEDFHSRQKSAHAAQSHYATESAERERQSQAAIHDVDTKYDHAITVMESIHGEPRRHGGTGSGTGTGTVPGGGVAPPGHHGSINPPPHTGIDDLHPWSDPTGHDHGPGGHDHDPGGHDHDPGGHDPGNIDAPPQYGDPGSPQGPGGYPTPGPGSTPPGGVLPPDGGNLPTGPTSTAIGGLISGGVVGGTSRLTGALRTSAMSAVTAEEQAALAASRTSGAGASGGAAAAGRGGAVGISGSSRGAGGGAGAGGRDGRGRKKKRPDGTDFFEDNEDWLDDDEAAPGVLH